MNSVRNSEEQLLYGVTLMTLSTVLIAFMSLFAKISGVYTSTSVIIFLQCLIGLIAILPVVIQQKTALSTKRLPWHVVRALTGTGAWYLLYQSIHLTSLTIGTLLTFSSPLLVPFIARFGLKSHVSASVWFAVALGFIGIILVLNPFHEGRAISALGIFFGLVSAILLSITQFVLRLLHKTESTLTVLFYYLLLSTLIFCPSALMNWNNPPLFVWGLMFLIGLLMAGNQFLFTCAYRFASPVHLGAFIYLSIVFSAILDALVLHTKLGILAWSGIILVIAGGMLIVRLEETTVTAEITLVEKEMEKIS